MAAVTHSRSPAPPNAPTLISVCANTWRCNAAHHLHQHGVPGEQDDRRAHRPGDARRRRLEQAQPLPATTTSNTAAKTSPKTANADRAKPCPNCACLAAASDGADASAACSPPPPPPGAPRPYPRCRGQPRSPPSRTQGTHPHGARPAAPRSNAAHAQHSAQSMPSTRTSTRSAANPCSPFMLPPRYQSLSCIQLA